MTVGVTRNPVEGKVPIALLDAAQRLGIATRAIDLPTVRVEISADGQASTFDQRGPIAVECLTPFLLFGFPAGVHAYRLLARTAHSQNPVDGVLAADDKATTAELLAAAGVPQVATQIVNFDLAEVASAADRFGYPVVVKRTHGAQGRWVRRAASPAALATAVEELAVEGPGALLVQPEVVECEGRSVRAVLTGGRLLASTQRVASAGAWRSNVSAGAYQHPVDLTADEHRLVARSAEALNLRHAGIDILRTNQGPRVLEVNACPAFTSMQAHFSENLAEAVLLASLAA